MWAKCTIIKLKHHHQNSYEPYLVSRSLSFAILCQISKRLSIFRKITSWKMGKLDNNPIDWVYVMTTCNLMTKPPTNLRMKPKWYNLISGQKIAGSMGSRPRHLDLQLFQQFAIRCCLMISEVNFKKESIFIFYKQTFLKYLHYYMKDVTIRFLKNL